MRLSLKLPFALILLVALVFFSLSMVNARYEKLEKLLVIFVASEKIDLVKDLSGDRRYFLAKGIPGDLDWFDSEFAQANGLTEVLSGRPKKFESVFYVGKIEWTSWDSVRLDYGIDYWASHRHCCEGARFRFANGRWSCVQDGLDFQLVQ